MFISRSSIENKVLSYYLLNSHARHYIRELARILDVDPGNLQKKLVELHKKGILLSQEDGKQKYYKLNPDFPLLKEYKAAFHKIGGIAQDLTLLLKKMDGIQEAYIYGSFAREKMDQFSDIDVLVVGNQNSLALAKNIHHLENRYQREINIVEFEPEEFSKKRKKNPFLKDVFARKVIRLV